jgi:metal-responsive CopG/Arc/MetJ family transcriptional regulator
MYDEYVRTRINIDVEPELLERFNRLIWHGMRSRVMRAVISQLLDAVEKEGIIVATLVADNRIRIFGGEQNG